MLGAVLLSIVFIAWSRWLTYPSGFYALVISIAGIWLYSVFSNVLPVANNVPSKIAPPPPLAHLMILFFMAWWISVGILVYFKDDILGIDLYKISGDSMNPTFTPGNYILIDTWAYQHQEPRRGDIVLFKLDYGEPAIIKRIRARSGDRVTYNRSHFSVDVSTTPEANSTHNGRYYDRKITRETVADGRYFLVGDNLKRSQDSRLFGPIGKEAILGKAAFVLW